MLKDFYFVIRDFENGIYSNMCVKWGGWKVSRGRKKVFDEYKEVVILYEMGVFWINFE